MELGPHAAYIWSAYAVVGTTLAVLIGWLIADGRRQQRLIDEFEPRSAPRSRN